MADIYFPASLPLPLQTGYQETREPAMSRSQMLNGSFKQRLVSKIVSIHASVKFIFTDTQYGTFLKFYDNELGEGVNWFYMKMLYNYDSTADVRYRLVRIQNGKITAVLKCFNGVQIWEVSLNLDVMPQE